MYINNHEVEIIIDEEINDVKVKKVWSFTRLMIVEEKPRK
mgnify:CR=1 FL=1